MAGVCGTPEQPGRSAALQKPISVSRSRRYPFLRTETVTDAASLTIDDLTPQLEARRRKLQQSRW